jgi:hypothetical protein
MALKSSILFLTGLFLAVAGTTVQATTLDRSSENNIKAAYLFNFAKFVTWPESAFASADAPIVFCVLDDEVLGSILETLESKTVTGRPLSITRIRTLADLPDGHILYIGENQGRRIPVLLEKVKNRPLLIVSSADDFTRKGGMIGFIRTGNTIRFQVNLDAVKQSGLVISSRLLKLAEIVESDDPGPP